jgi:transcriptional regulator with XRE-family HTH domain
MTRARVLAAALAKCGGVQTILAKRLGVNPRVLSRWLGGGPGPGRRYLVPLAEIAGVDPVDVLEVDILAGARGWRGMRAQ